MSGRVGRQSGIRVYTPELTPRQREAYLNIEVRDRGIREVARELELNAGTVYRHLERARSKLRRDA